MKGGKIARSGEPRSALREGKGIRRQGRQSGENDAKKEKKKGCEWDRRRWRNTDGRGEVTKKRLSFPSKFGKKGKGTGREGSR